MYLVFAKQITLLCVNKTLNPFGFSKLLNTITLAVIQTYTHTQSQEHLQQEQEVLGHSLVSWAFDPKSKRGIGSNAQIYPTSSVKAQPQHHLKPGDLMF